MIDESANRLRFEALAAVPDERGVRRFAAAEAIAAMRGGASTAAFAVNAIRSWLGLMGRERYPNAASLLITADGGGGNGSRVRLGKIELQELVIGQKIGRSY